MKTKITNNKHVYRFIGKLSAISMGRKPRMSTAEKEWYAVVQEQMTLYADCLDDIDLRLLIIEALHLITAPIATTELIRTVIRYRINVEVRKQMGHVITLRLLEGKSLKAIMRELDIDDPFHMYFIMNEMRHSRELSRLTKELGLDPASVTFLFKKH